MKDRPAGCGTKADGTSGKKGGGRLKGGWALSGIRDGWGRNEEKLLLLKKKRGADCAKKKKGGNSQKPGVPPSREEKRGTATSAVGREKTEGKGGVRLLPTKGRFEGGGSLQANRAQKSRGRGKKERPRGGPSCFKGVNRENFGRDKGDGCLGTIHEGLVPE